jgi:hypothetical protein
MSGRNNYINSKLILYCILTTLLILRTVTFNHRNDYFNLCGTSNIQVETYDVHAKEISLQKVNS